MDDANSDYGQLLEAAMERQGLGVTATARLLAAKSGNRMESERANLRTYLHRGKMPNRKKAGHLAEVLAEPALAVYRPRDRELAELRRQILEVREALRVAGILPLEQDGEPRRAEGAPLAR